MEKVCRDCGLPKDIDEFCIARGNADGRSNQCKACRKIYGAKYYADHKAQNQERDRARYALDKSFHKDRMLWYSRERKYGITKDQYFGLLDRQNGVCAICRTDNPGTGRDPLTGWAVDHCHVTNSVRGLLCSDCNVGLGKFKDSTKSLRSAIFYLRRP